MPADESPRWRVFTAVDIPAAVREALRGPLDGLRPLEAWLRPNAPDRIHLTLHFLGHLPVAQVEQLPTRLEPLVAAHQRFGLSAHGVGAFPNLSHAQVLWAGIAGPGLPQLLTLQRELGGALTQAGIPLEDRFHPHLTLARVRRPLRAPARRLIDGWYATWRDTALGGVPVDEVRLMRSEIGAGPPRYSVLQTFALK